MPTTRPPRRPARGPARRASPVRRLRRAERREQLLAAATRAFARTGFADTSLDDIAEPRPASAGSSCTGTSTPRPTCTAPSWTARCGAATAAIGTGDFTDASIDALLRAAAADPDGFRLLFHHAAREPEFRQPMDAFHTKHGRHSPPCTRRASPTRPGRGWAAQLVPDGRDRRGHRLARRRPTRPRPGRRPHPRSHLRRYRRRPVTQPPPRRSRGARTWVGCGWLGGMSTPQVGDRRAVPNQAASWPAASAPMNATAARSRVVLAHAQLVGRPSAAHPVT